MFSFLRKRPSSVADAAQGPTDPTPPATLSGAVAEAGTTAADDPAPARAGWVQRLRQGLRKTGQGLSQAFTVARIDEGLYEELESALLMADAGVSATTWLLEDLKQRVRKTRATDIEAVKACLVQALVDLLSPMQRSLRIGPDATTVIMVCGVNGVGKTTTIGKLTHHLAQSGQKVLLAAADTFRAAAREQLGVWGDRNRVDIVSQQGGDPSAVSFDAVTAARARGCDVVIADTAGRLPTQAHLMEELRKIGRTIGKAQAGAPHEVLLVLDGNTGQNALAQLQAFDAAVPLTGLIVTKLDGTAKGGVLIAIARWCAAQRRPIALYFVGVGEGLEDLQTFDAREFARALVP